VASTERPIALIDCVNYRDYSHTSLLHHQSQYQRPFTFSIDTTTGLHTDSSGNPSLVTIWADLSSETGEPLFLRFTGGSATNREHCTHGGARINIPQLNLQLAGNYRHIGTYADRIEQYCAAYAFSRGASLRHQNIGHFGIAEYITGQWDLNVASGIFKGIFNKYGEWTMVPGLYLPIYREGNTYIQTLAMPLFSGKLTMSGNIRRENEFPDHKDITTSDYYSVKTTYSHSLSKSNAVSIQIHSSSEKSSRHYVQASLENTRVPSLAIQFSAGLWSGGHPEIQTEICYQLFDKCTISTEYSYEFTPGEKSISVLTPEHHASVHFSPTRSNNITLTTRYFNSSPVVPFSLSVWSHMISNPEFLYIDTTSERVTARFMESSHRLFQIGGEANLKIPVNDLTLSLYSRGNYTTTGVPCESVPFESGIKLAYTSKQSRPIRSDVALAWRAPYTWNAKYNGFDSDMTSPSILSCDFELSIPFYLPLFTSMLAPEISISARPIPLVPSGRQRFHPFGTEIGPHISVLLNCDIQPGNVPLPLSGT
jgi:hypothetical protein